MINTVNLRNFKLHKDTTIDFGKINVFIGPNNSGKSSVFHAVQLLKKEIFLKKEKLQIVDSERSAKDKFIDIGDDLDDFIHHGEKSFEIKISGTIFLKDFLSQSGLETAKKFISNDKVEIFSTYIIQDKKLSLLSHKIQFSNSNKLFEEKKFKELLEMINDVRKMLECKKIEHKLEAKDIFIEAKDIFAEKEILELNARREHIKENWQIYNRLLEGISGDPMEEFITVLLFSPERLIKSAGFVYPTRGLETLTYKTMDKKTTELNFDNVNIASRAQSVANFFIYNRLCEDEIYEKMKEVIDVRFFAELGKTKDEVKLMSKEKNVPFLFEGLGAHQMLFIYLPIFLAKQNDTICIEEPENHLHPKAQYQLSKLFANIAKQQEKQLVITTHSEHIVFGLLNMVAKKELKNDELAIYYFENKYRKAEVKKLEINEFGQVKGGLPGFFEAAVEGLLEFLSEPDEEDK